MLTSTGVIRHDSPLRIAWDIVITVTAGFAFVVFSYRLTNPRAGLDALFWLVAAVFLADIVLSFNTGTRRRLQVLEDRAAIVRQYLRGWFGLDLAAALPLIAAALVLADGRSLAPAAALFALGVPPLAKMAKVVPAFRRLQEDLGITPAVMRLLVFFFIFVLAVHAMGLGWILIGAAEPSRPARDQYLRAVYWVLSTIATIGYGDYVPDHDSNPQILYTIAVQVIGVGIYSYIIGNMASLIANLDVAKAAFLKKREEVTEFLRSRRIPGALQKRVRDYYAYLWETRRSASAVTLTQELPHTLAMAIQLFLNREIIEKVSLFREAGDLFIREIVQLLRPLVFLPDDFIITQGEFGDCMYFLSSGQVEVLVNGKQVASLGPGSPFGETALLQGEQRNASVRTLSYCDVYRLSKSDFDSLRAKYREFDAQVKRVDEERREDTRRKTGQPAVRNPRRARR
jgi:hypothetical protein